MIFHGTLFEFLRNEALDAENYFLNFQPAPGVARKPKDKFRRNQFGAVVSGPLIKNKTFWAFNWESRRDKIGALQERRLAARCFSAGRFLRVAHRNHQPCHRPAIPHIPSSSTTRLPEIRFPTTSFRKTACTRGHSMCSRSMFQKPNSGRRIHSTSQPGTLSISLPTRTRISDGWITTSVIETASLAGSRSIGQELTRDNINPNLPVFVDSNVTNLATSWVHTFSQNMINELRVGFNISDDLTIQSAYRR